MRGLTNVEKLYGLLNVLLNIVVDGIKDENNLKRFIRVQGYRVYKKGEWIVLEHRWTVNESTTRVKQFYIKPELVDENLLKAIQKLLHAMKEIYRALGLIDECGECR